MPKKETTKKTTTRSKTTGSRTSASTKKSNGTKKVTLVSPVEIDQKIRSKAYELYLKRGAYHGNDMEDWFKAEKEVKKEYSLV